MLQVPAVEKSAKGSAARREIGTSQSWLRSSSASRATSCAIELSHGERAEGGAVDGDGNGVGTEEKGAVRCSGGQVRVRARLWGALFLFVTTTHAARAHRSVVQRPTDCPIRNRMADATDPRATPSPLIDAVTRGGWTGRLGCQLLGAQNRTVCLARRVCRTDIGARWMRCGGTMEEVQWCRVHELNACWVSGLVLLSIPSVDGTWTWELDERLQKNRGAPNSRRG